MGAIALGAKVIEKHFTDDNSRKGPDHAFSLNSKTWSQMVKSSRLLELSLGNGKKKIEFNEKQSVIVQRRGIWIKKPLKKGQVLKKNHIEILRPCPKGSISPFNINKYIGKRVKKDLKTNKLLTKKCLVL